MDNSSGLKCPAGGGKPEGADAQPDRNEKTVALVVEGGVGDQPGPRAAGRRDAIRCQCAAEIESCNG